MHEQGSRAVDSDRFHDPKPFVDPFDPVALAARLAEARAQRAVALANRGRERPHDSQALSQTKIVGSSARPFGARALPQIVPAQQKELRADPGMRAVPVRAIEPRRLGEAGVEKPARSGRALVLGAFLAGCVTVGLAALALAPWFSPQNMTETNVAETTARQPEAIAAPEPLASYEAGPAAALPDPVPPFAPGINEDGPSGTGGFVSASGGEASATIAATPAPPRLQRPGLRALIRPSAPPPPTLSETSIEIARLSDPPPQPAAANRSDEVAVARPPAIGLATPQASVEAPSVPGDAPESGVTDVPPTAGAASRVAVFYPAGADVAAAAALAGLEGVTGLRAPTPVGHDIGRTNVRFYHEADRPAARAVADALSAEARDFTDFMPRPEPGTIEVWLAGEAAPAAPAVAAAPRPERVRAAPASSAPEAQLRASVDGEDQQRLQQQVQRLLREQLRELRRR